MRPPSPARHNTSGFTLVEVLVAVAVVAITLAAGLKAAGALTDNAQRLSEIYALDVDPQRVDHYLFDGTSIPLTRELMTVEFKNGDGLSSETRAHILLQSALAHHAAGEDDRALASLRAAFSLSPDLTVAADAYGAPFARLAEAARGAAD